MKALRGICTKLEYKAILYVKGLSNKDIVDIIRMKDYFSVSYKRSQGFTAVTEIDHSEIYDCINNHAKSLLKLVQ